MIRYMGDPPVCAPRLGIVNVWEKKNPNNRRVSILHATCSLTLDDI